MGKTPGTARSAACPECREARSADRPRSRSGGVPAMSQAGPSASLGHHRLTLENVSAKSDTPATWGDLVVEWKEYVREKSTQNLVFVGDGEDNHDEIMTAPYSHRFTQEYTKMQYAKIQDFIRGALGEYEDPHLVFLTFSASTTTPTGDPRPPIDHMNEVVDTWGEGVYYELNQVMDGARKSDPWEPREDWEYLYILEPTTNEGHVPGGYAHAHAAIVVDGPVESHRFESVIDRHITEAPNATAQAHEFEDAIEVKEAESLNNPGAYMFKYLGKSWDVDGMEDYEERFAALIFDQERQRFRPSNGAQRWMERDGEESEKGEWIFAGVATDEQTYELTEYEDLQDFAIAKGQGLRAWLRKRKASKTDSGTSVSLCSCGTVVHEVAMGVCPGCGRQVSTDRPPPEGEGVGG